MCSKGKKDRETQGRRKEGEEIKKGDERKGEKEGEKGKGLDWAV